MMNRVLTIILITAFASVFSDLSGQKSYWEYGLGIGTSTYWGDLSPSSFGKNMATSSVAGNLFLRYNYNRNISAKLNVTIGKLKGDDANSSDQNRIERNLNFFSPLTEFAGIIEYNLFGLEPSDSESRFTPYVSAGFGLFRFNPMTEYNGNKIRLQALGTEGQSIDGFDDRYSLTQLAIPFGAGIKLRVSKLWTLNVEFSARYTVTDYIDDVSKRYVAYETLLLNNGELAANLSDRTDEYLMLPEGSANEPFSIRGSPDVNDYYSLIMVSLSYNIGPKLKFGGNRRIGGANCPRF